MAAPRERPKRRSCCPLVLCRRAGLVAPQSVYVRLKHLANKAGGADRASAGKPGEVCDERARRRPRLQRKRDPGAAGQGAAALVLRRRLDPPQVPDAWLEEYADG